MIGFWLSTISIGAVLAWIFYMHFKGGSDGDKS